MPTIDWTEIDSPEHARVVALVNRAELLMATNEECRTAEPGTLEAARPVRQFIVDMVSAALAAGQYVELPQLSRLGEGGVRFVWAHWRGNYEIAFYRNAPCPQVSCPDCERVNISPELAADFALKAMAVVAPKVMTAAEMAWEIPGPR